MARFVQGSGGNVATVDVWSLLCECGATITARSEEELVRNAERHIDEEHPRLRGAASREQWLAMASRREHADARD